MNEPHIKTDQKDVLFRNTRYCAMEQVDLIHRNNYLNSCEAHGGDSAEVAKIVRAEFAHCASLEFYEDCH